MPPQNSAFNTCFHIHMVSDSTGETLMEVMRASVAQFEGTSPLEHLYALVRSSKQLDRVLDEVAAYPGVVMYTMVNADLRRELETRCVELGVPAIAILDPMLATLSAYLGRQVASRAGAQRSLDADYYRRIDALNYAMAHDDGQGDDFEGADIVLLGVSRTSKTPTSVYLAHRGFRAANIPLVKDVPLPPAIFSLRNPLVVGLTASPERIVQIRRNRLLSLNEDRDTNYIDDFAVREEILYAKRLYAKHKWPTIDVTRRSIEETAAKIINLLMEKRNLTV
ncbi:pyruvate, water dikinase regulatory protein [Maricaulis maris]|jgi:[pyruvate, water dikinase]-phosphate phosphotransferase / [pyruvate, water dikinase] kinase|uniref:pyruvate, water dikinase regulatory protein n=1 Tax=Maricaulis maris TaxID=74318 RepID=UPI0029255C1C|nr:putative pyruvate, phosphate dikinase regulatory protein [Maricaulis maris]